MSLKCRLFWLKTTHVKSCYTVLAYSFQRYVCASVAVNFKLKKLKGSSINSVTRSNLPRFKIIPIFALQYAKIGIV